MKGVPMIRNNTLAAALVVLLVGSAVAAVATDDLPEGDSRLETLVVTADYVGVTIDGGTPNFANGGGVTYALGADGSSEILWASSDNALDDGDTARWVGTLTTGELAFANAYVAETEATVDASTTDGAPVASLIYCTNWAYNPVWDWNDNGMSASATHFCAGDDWKRHKVDGRLQRKWGWFWRTTDNDGTGWSYVENRITAWLFTSCKNDNLTHWRSKAIGVVEAWDGRASRLTSYSDVVRDVECGV